MPALDGQSRVEKSLIDYVKEELWTGLPMDA
jgi:hypothetical protein